MKTLKDKQEQAIQNKNSQVRQNKPAGFTSPPCEFTGDLVSQMKNATPPPCQFTGNLVSQMKAAQQRETSSNGLPTEVLSKMENAFAQDFSDVNIHKDSNSATDAGALAYAQGNDVHFAPGQFKPDTSSGQELIGHELAHVVQQREGRVSPTHTLPRTNPHSTSKGMAVNDDPGLEKEADDMGRKAAQGDLAELQVSTNNMTRTNSIAQLQANANQTSFNPYPANILKGLKLKQKWAFRSAAKWDVLHNQVSFKRMDTLEGHDDKVFNSYHFERVVDFYYKNAIKEASEKKGETEAAWKQCSPAMYFAMNKLYNWEGEDKIKSGYVEDHKDPTTGKTSKGIITLMEEKGLVGADKKFVAVDKKGVAGHYSKEPVAERAVKLNESIANWARDKTLAGGIGVFLVSVHKGYHSLTLIVDRRGKGESFRLLDQHGNKSTGSDSTFDRLKAHTQKGIDAYFVKMAKSWGERYDNYNFRIVELKRD